MKVLMPCIGMGMRAGLIVRWHRGNHASVRKGEPLVDVETEKLSLTIPAPQSGTLIVLAVIGDIVNCGEAVGEIL